MLVETTMLARFFWDTMHYRSRDYRVKRRNGVIWCTAHVRKTQTKCTGPKPTTASALSLPIVDGERETGRQQWWYSKWSSNYNQTVFLSCLSVFSDWSASYLTHGKRQMCQQWLIIYPTQILQAVMPEFPLGQPGNNICLLNIWLLFPCIVSRMPVFGPFRGKVNEWRYGAMWQLQFGS